MSRDESSRYGRIADLADVSNLARRRVTMVGCGSMSQPISTQLVRHGVGTQVPGRIRLIDGDVVSERNFIGTEYRQEHLGIPKAQAAAEMLREINPLVNVSYWVRHLEDSDIEAVADMAGLSDLLVLAADSFETMLAISARCQDICPQVMAVFGERADHAEVAFSVPGQTQPLAKTLGRRKRQAIGRPQAFGCDTAFVCSFVAAVCLRLLIGEEGGDGLLACYSDAPLFLVGLRRSWIFENLPDDVVRTIVCVQTPKEAES